MVLLNVSKYENNQNTNWGIIGPNIKYNVKWYINKLLIEWYKEII